MEHDAIFISQKERIQKTLEPLLNELLEEVREKNSPPTEQIDRACELLQKYLDELSKGPLSEVEIDFTDIPPDLTAADEIKNIDQWPLLYRIGMQKVLSSENTHLEYEQIEVLKNHGYLVDGAIVSKYRKDNFYVVTSKGLEALGTLTSFWQRIPKPVSVFMQSGDRIKLCQAAAISLYYRFMADSVNYFTFVFPEYPDFMFGCQIGKEEENIYVMAGIAPSEKQKKIEEMMQEFGKKHAISKLVIIVPSALAKAQWEKITRSENWISYFVLWETDGYV